jgi:hypothetical protein
MFGGIAKWVAEIDHADRVPEFISRAYHVATSGRPGSGGSGPAGRHARRDSLMRPAAGLATGRNASGIHSDG